MKVPSNLEIFLRTFNEHWVVLVIPFLALLGTHDVWKDPLFWKTTSCVWILILGIGFYMERRKISLQIQVAELRRLLGKSK